VIVYFFCSFPFGKLILLDKETRRIGSKRKGITKKRKRIK
jgi:hypothetical protein